VRPGALWCPESAPGSTLATGKCSRAHDGATDRHSASSICADANRIMMPPGTLRKTASESLFDGDDESEDDDAEDIMMEDRAHFNASQVRPAGRTVSRQGPLPPSAQSVVKDC